MKYMEHNLSISYKKCVENNDNSRLTGELKPRETGGVATINDAMLVHEW